MNSRKVYDFLRVDIKTERPLHKSFGALNSKNKFRENFFRNEFLPEGSYKMTLRDYIVFVYLDNGVEYATTNYKKYTTGKVVFSYERRNSRYFK